MYISKFAFVAAVFASASAFSQSPQIRHTDPVVPLSAASAELAGGSAIDSCRSSPVKCSPALRTDFFGLSTLAVLAASVDPFEAEAGTDRIPETSMILIVNNGHDRMSVYVVGRNGRRYFAGTVKPTRVGQFELPAALASTGETVQVRIFPRSQPAGFGLGARGGAGIQTVPMRLEPGQSIHLFIEPTLDRSTAQVTADLLP